MQARAEEAGKRLLTFTIEAQVRFAEPGDLYTFTDELAEAVRQVVARFDSRDGRPYRLVAAGYPASDKSSARRSNAMSPDTPRIEVTVAAPVDAVWNALRDKNKIRHWHGWDYDGLDNEIDIIYFTEHTEDARARTLEVQGGDRFELEPDGDGTRITLTRVVAGSDPDWETYYDDITEGWITFLQQLKFLLERRPDAPRRTLFFSSEKAGPVVDELGLRDIAGQPAGTPFTANLVGEDVKGEVWFRSRHQLGVTVDTWGLAGLLIVATKPDGAAMALLSTYGLDEARYDNLNARWTAWWSQRST